MRRVASRPGTSLGALCIAAFASQSAHAAVPGAAVEAAEAPATDGLAEIVVTAQKRETNLQRTPIAINVLGNEDLVNRHVLTLTDLGDGSIPSLRVAPFFARKSALVVNIRGVGALGDANQPAREQGAGVYVDGVYLGRAQGLGAALYDVERIEVLKGPQGTLFGRNTEGGAVSIVTRRPGGEFRLDARAGISNFNGYEGVIHLDLPTFADISIKLDGLFQRRGGTVENPLAGQQDFNNYKRWGGHAAIMWSPSADFTALYQYDRTRDGTTPYIVQLFAPGSLPLAPLTPPRPDRVRRADIGVPLQESIGHVGGHQLNLEWRASDALQVKSISSYREVEQSQYDNGALALSVYRANGTFARYSLANFDQHQWSQEIQLIGKLPRVDLVGGGFYYHEAVNDDAWSPNTLRWNATGTDYVVLPPPGIAQSPFPDRASHARTDSAAVFGQGTWTPPILADTVHLTLGGRYSHDKKAGELTKVNGALPFVNGVTGEVPFEIRNDRFDPLVNLAVDVTSGIHAYGKWSTGYKAGGANSRSLTYRGFGPESLSVFEVGIKTEFLDRRLRLNAAAYTGRYKNVQIDFNLNTLQAGVNRTTLETVNADGNGRIKGVEAELTIAPVRGLTLNGSYAYTYVRLPEARNPFVAGSPLVPVYPIYTPRNAASGSIDYALPVTGDATAFVHFDANIADRQFTSASDRTKSDRQFLANGRIGLSDLPLGAGGGRLEVAIWARNLFDRDYVFLRNFNAALGTYGIYNEPRTYGIEARIRL